MVDWVGDGCGVGCVVVWYCGVLWVDVCVDVWCGFCGCGECCEWVVVVCVVVLGWCIGCVGVCEGVSDGVGGGVVIIGVW